jgi:DNA-binding transcriptional ArsR family regulator
MNTTTVERLVKDVMPRPDALQVELFVSGGAELLIGLAAVATDYELARRAASWVPDVPPDDVRRALGRLGSGSGELWLHLLGAALEAGAVSAAEFFAQTERLDARELREHVVGLHVPAWRSIVGAETLERAAAGDEAAVRRLLRDDRYYGGEASRALETVLPLTPQQTKRRILAVLRAWLDVFSHHEGQTVAELEADADAKRALVGELDPPALIALATGGYVYEREPEFRRITLVPHLAGRPWLFLCQHRETRIICYPAKEKGSTRRATSSRAVALGKALGDEQRIAILGRLTLGEASLGDLADAAGLAKSTAHHHLVLLRGAGLVGLRGAARAYRYFLLDDALTSSRNLLAEVLTPRNR